MSLLSGASLSVGFVISCLGWLASQAPSALFSRARARFRLPVWFPITCLGFSLPVEGHFS